MRGPCQGSHCRLAFAELVQWLGRGGLRGPDTDIALVAARRQLLPVGRPTQAAHLAQSLGGLECAWLASAPMCSGPAKTRKPPRGKPPGATGRAPALPAALSAARGRGVRHPRCARTPSAMPRREDARHADRIDQDCCVPHKRKSTAARGRSPRRAQACAERVRVLPRKPTRVCPERVTAQKRGRIRRKQRPWHPAEDTAPWRNGSQGRDGSQASSGANDIRQTNVKITRCAARLREQEGFRFMTKGRGRTRASREHKILPTRRRYNQSGPRQFCKNQVAHAPCMPSLFGPHARISTKTRYNRQCALRGGRICHPPPQAAARGSDPKGGRQMQGCGNMDCHTQFA